MPHSLRDYAERLERRRTERRTIKAFEKARENPHLARDIGVVPRSRPVPSLVTW